MAREVRGNTVITCNRCEAKGVTARLLEIEAEGPGVWRVAYPIMRHPTCEHVDAHWVYDRDQEVIE